MECMVLLIGTDPDKKKGYLAEDRLCTGYIEFLSTLYRIVAHYGFLNFNKV